MKTLDTAGWVAAARESLQPPEEPIDSEMWGPRSAWQEGSHLLNKVINGWFVGEDVAFTTSLANAARLLDAPDEQGTPYGATPARWLALHRTAQALCRWMQGNEDRARWEIADAAWQRLDPEAMRDPLRSEHARVVAAMAANRSLEPDELASMARGALAVMPRASIAIALALAFHRPGWVREPPLAILAVYALLPELRLTATLARRGWTDRREAEVTLAPDHFDRVDGVLQTLGLTPQRDAMPRPPPRARWKRRPPVPAQVDWQVEPSQQARISLRGEGAGRIAALLVQAIDGVIAP